MSDYAILQLVSAILLLPGAIIILYKLFKWLFDL
jgi:hypothetical protein